MLFALRLKEFLKNKMRIHGTESCMKVTKTNILEPKVEGGSVHLVGKEGSHPQDKKT